MARVFHSSHLVWLITALLTGIFVALPIGYIVYNSFTLGGKLSFEPFVRYFASDSSVIRAAANSFILATAVAVVSVLVGVPLAFGVSRTDMAWKGLVRATVIVAIITPPFLRTMAYILLFGPNAGSVNVFLRQYFFPDLLTGPLNIYSLSGLILLCSPGGIAQVFILTSTALAQMDPSLEEVARITGANRWRTIWQVTLKVTRNAILAGALMAFTVSLALYGTPHLLGIDVLTTEIRQALMMPVNFKKAAVLSNFSIIASVIALILYRRAIRNGAQFQTVTGKGFRPAMMAMGKARHLFTILGVVYGVVSFVLPYGALLIMSFTKVVGRPLSAGNVTLEHYKYVFTSPFVLASIKNSAILAVSTATICTLMTIVLAYIVVRTQIRGRALLDFINILPQGISGTAIAVGLILVYTSPLFRGLQLYGTIWIILLAYIARDMPMSFRNIQSSFMQVSRELEEAARVSGAGWLRTVAKITVPLVKEGVTYAWVMVFLSAIPELSASIILRHVGNSTVATALLDIWSGAGGFQKASALGSAIFILVAVVYFSARKFAGKSVFEI